MDRSAFTKSVTPTQHAAIAAWWKAFAEAEEQIDQFFSNKDRSFDVVAFMRTHLGAVSPLLGWEFGPPVAGKSHRLVLTPESYKNLRPLVQAILKAAPPASRFEFYPYRLPDTVKQAEFVMKGRTGWENIAAIDYEITPGQFNTFDLHYYLPWDGDEDELTGKALVLTETLLGEERLDKWVGIIDIKKKAPASQGLMAKFGLATKEQGSPIAGLRADFEARIAAAKAAFVPYRQLVNEQTKWCLFEFEPKDQDAPDYAAKEDILVSPFVDANLMRATMQGGSAFYSERFSRDETFIYLKLDAAADDINLEIFEDRAAIETALGDALEPANLGCTLGGGTGRRYSYVDMAVTDLNAAIPLIRETLRAGKLTKRSWLLFQDADLQSEWIGIWDDSPMPPASPVLEGGSQEGIRAG